MRAAHRKQTHALSGEDRHAGFCAAPALRRGSAQFNSAEPQAESQLLFLLRRRVAQNLRCHWQRVYRRLFKVANLRQPGGAPKRCHGHMFRDTFAVEMLSGGVPIDQVSILLGHASVRVTEKHYSPWACGRQDQLEKSVQSTRQVRTADRNDPTAQEIRTARVHGDFWLKQPSAFACK